MTSPVRSGSGDGRGSPICGGLMCEPTDASIDPPLRLGPLFAAYGGLDLARDRGAALGRVRSGHGGRGGRSRAFGCIADRGRSDGLGCPGQARRARSCALHWPRPQVRRGRCAFGGGCGCNADEAAPSLARCRGGRVEAAHRAPRRSGSRTNPDREQVARDNEPAGPRRRPGS